MVETLCQELTEEVQFLSDEQEVLDCSTERERSELSEQKLQKEYHKSAIFEELGELETERDDARMTAEDGRI